MRTVWLCQLWQAEWGSLWACWFVSTSLLTLFSLPPYLAVGADIFCLLTIMTAFPLVFQNTAFDVVDQNGQAWLKASELAEALGYARPDALNKIYDRYADEFNNTMTQNVNLTLSNKNNELQTANVRIFSLRGAHLIAMFSRTAIAKQFRKWVLDILDREVVVNSRATITPEQKSTLLAIVEQRGQGQRKIFAEMWSRHNRHFNINSYHELLAVRFHEACDYLKTMEIRQKIAAPVAPMLNLPDGRHFLVVEQGVVVYHKDASNHNLINADHTDALKTDMRTVEDALSELRNRMRILSGEYGIEHFLNNRLTFSFS